MNHIVKVALLCGAQWAALAGTAFAQDKHLEKAEAEAERTGSAFAWEGSVEIGYESIFDSNLPGNQTDTAYATGEIAATFALGDTASLFAGVTFEEVEDALGATGYGFYIHEIGLQFGIGAAEVLVGKVHPVFGSAWDSAAGFYGGALAEDYELTEQIGALANVDLGAAGMLSLGVFYADDTVLSESAGFNRGRSSTASGGAGNTGKLDNVALQWSGAWDATYAHVGLRHLSAGIGDVSDETGVVAGIGHSFTPTGVPLDLFAEVAAFDGYGGSADDATYLTLNAAYAIGDLTVSGTYARRDIDSAGVTDLISLAVEYELENGITLGGAVAHVDDAGVRDKLVGINIVIPLGG